MFIISARSKEDAPVAVNEGEDTDDCRRVTSFLSCLASSCSRRRLDNADCEENFSVDQSENDVALMVGAPTVDGHEEKVRKSDDKGFEERG